MYASSTQVRLACVKRMSAWMPGSATFTIVMSSTIISCPRHTTASAAQRRRCSEKSICIAIIISTGIIYVKRVLPINMTLPTLVQSPPVNPPGTLAMLLHLSKAVHRRSTDDLLGMRLRQFLVLSYLNERSPLRQQDLCETLMLDANNCVLLLNELETAGWTQRTRDTDDRRRHVVEITAAGREALQSARRAQNSLEDEVLAALDAEEREQLRGLLRKTLVGLQGRTGEPVATS